MSLKIPDECYKEFGSDIDGCSRQENEGCKGCSCATEVPDETPHIPHPMDCTDEEFSTWLCTAKLGDVYSIENLLTQAYNEMKRAKDDLVMSLAQPYPFGGNEKKQVKAKDTLKQMYAMLQRMETRVFQCRKRKEQIETKLR